MNYLNVPVSQRPLMCRRSEFQIYHKHQHPVDVIAEKKPKLRMRIFLSTLKVIKCDPLPKPKLKAADPPKKKGRKKGETPLPPVKGNGKKKVVTPTTAVQHTDNAGFERIEVE